MSTEAPVTPAEVAPEAAGAVPAVAGAPESPGAAAAGGHEKPAEGHGHGDAKAHKGLSRRTKRLGMLATAVLSVIAILGWFVLFTGGPTPEAKMKYALELLDKKKLFEAREIAKELESQKYVDADFPAAVPYVLGMSAAYKVTELPLEERRAQYVTASGYLEEILKTEVPESREPECVFLLGKIYHTLDAFHKARPLLEKSLEAYPPAVAESAWMLAEELLDPSVRNESLLGKALDLNTTFSNTIRGNPILEDEGHLQRAEILLAMNRLAESEQELRRVVTPSKKAAAQVQSAQLMLARGQVVEAFGLVEPLTASPKVDKRVMREAGFVCGLAAEAAGNSMLQTGGNPSDVMRMDRFQQWRRKAISAYLEAAEKNAGASEELAGHLKAGRLLQEAGNDEKGYKSFVQVLRSIKDPEEFHNRWVSVDAVRKEVLEAWAVWMGRGDFELVVQLSESMTPLFPVDQAYQMTARAQTQWAEKMEAEYQRMNSAVRRQKEAELRLRWRTSAEAYARLAHARRLQSDYADALWLAAEQYRHGHDNQNALNYLNQFLETRPDARLASARVFRAQLLLDLDKVEEAKAELEAVLQKHNTDSAAFQAAVLLGSCCLELNQLDEAEQQWRQILVSNRLTPAAAEWREALFLLGNLMLERGMLHRRDAERNGVALPEVEASWAKADKCWDEASRRLKEYLIRFPDSPQANHVRVRLAKSLSQQGWSINRKLKQAETDNARMRNRQESRDLWLEALTHYKQVQESLHAASKRDQLTDVMYEIYAESWFEEANTLFAVERYEDAILAYSSASNRFPRDVRVLTAYLQMAESYTRLNRTVEARSMIEQARVMLQHQQIPETAFNGMTSNFTRTEWEDWLNRLRQLQ